MAILDKKTQDLISYYEVLNVNPEASDEDIKNAYHRMAKRYHPDQNPQNRRMSELRFKLINEAYLGIKTREKRAHYNRMLRLRAQNDNKSAKKSTQLTKKSNNTTQSLFSQIANMFFPQRTSSKSSSQASSRKG